MSIERCESLETKDATGGIVLTMDQFNHLVEWTECLYEWDSEYARTSGGWRRRPA